jgi:hypothetical protein
MSRSRDYVWQIALTLQRHQIIPQVSDEIIERACEELREKAGLFGTQDLRSADLCLEILHTLMPQDSDRFLSFKTDIEPDNCEEAAQIIRELAQVARGQWEQASISSSTLVDSSAEVTQAIDFDFRGEHFHWEFTIAKRGGRTHWRMSFYTQLDEFLETHLEGAFFALLESIGSFGNTDGCYLPRPVVTDLNAIQEMIETDFDFEGFDAFIKEL